MPNPSSLLSYPVTSLSLQLQYLKQEDFIKFILPFLAKPMNLMKNIFSSKRTHTTNIIQLCQDNYCCRPDSRSSYCCTATIAVLKSQTFFFQLNTKNSLMKSLTLSKTFLYLLNFPSTNSNLVTYLALFKEDQATHTPSILLSPPYFETSFILLPYL